MDRSAVPPAAPPALTPPDGSARDAVAPDVAAPDAVGDALRAALAGRYAVERLLGAGGMGSVWLARDEALDRLAAVKVIAPELTTSPVLRQRFLQEARTVARLHHPHVVGVYAAGEALTAAGPLLWFAMEYVAGGSLRDHLERRLAAAAGPGDPRVAAHVLRDLADALAAAHAAGVVHRDLKPENVLVEAGTGRALLTDFGVARALQGDGAGGAGGDGRMTRTGMVMGSPRYMSPEQAAGDRDLDGRSDLYALGLLGYELLAGEPAFTGGTPATLLVRQLTEPPPPLAPRVPDAPAALLAVIDRALAKSPDDRWPDAAAMRDALDVVLAGGDLPALPGSVLPSGAVPAGPRRRATAAGGATAPVPVPNAPPRRPRVAVLAGALAVALGGAVAVFAGRGGAGGPPPGVDPRRSFAVAPFDVLSPDPQLQWLREGSVNMLTLDLAQWKDVRVADYERTLDLLRDLELDAARRLGLDDARALARRAGAWTVVTGRVQSTPDSLFVVASLYDVASGRKLDEAQRAGRAAADPRPLFDALAGDLLDVAGVAEGAAPGTAQLTRTTTASLGAYRDYLTGLRALNGWRLPAADSLFARAVAQDSTFALAWYKRALGRGWANTGDDAQRDYMARAVAHADRLPARERAIVRAYEPLTRAFTEGVRAGPAASRALLDTARQRYAAVIAADSLAAEAWYGLGDAWFHWAQADQMAAKQELAARTAATPAAAPDPAAVARAYARSAHGWSESRRAFDRTIALDPSFHLAYSHLLNIYQAMAGPRADVVFDGDSLRGLPDSAAALAYGGAARVEASRARARGLLLGNARGWAAADPDSPNAQLALMQAYAGVGLPDSAAAAVDRALARPGLRAPELAYAAVTAQLAADPARVPAALRRALARYPADSVRGMGAPATFGHYVQAAGAAAAVGRLGDARRVLAAAESAVPTLTRPGMPPMPTGPMLRWYEASLRAALGVAGAADARALAGGVRAVDGARAAGDGGFGDIRAATLPVAYVAYLATRDSQFLAAARRWAGPHVAGPRGLPELEALAALDRGDTAAAAALARAFPRSAPATSLSFNGMRAVGRAEVLARAGDARGALARYEALDPARFTSFALLDVGWPLYARSFLARAALYEQLGDRAAAAGAYERLLALWKDADPALAPQVAAARAGLARARDARPAAGVPVGR